VGKKRTITLPPESVMEVPTEEPRSVRFKRTAWLLGGVFLAIVGLYWMLAENQPKPNGPESFSGGENSPDAVIEKFHLVSTVKGEKRWELFSDIARLYQGQKQAYSDNIYAQYYKAGKLVSTLTADKAIINTETNSTQAEGHVELIVENGSKLETDRLHWDPDTDQIKTDARVHIYKGMDDITAIGLVADTQLNNIRFVKDVHTQVRDTREIEHFDKKKKF
jgi:LPS export ABC transporter protein LptC